MKKLYSMLCGVRLWAALLLLAAGTSPALALRVDYLEYTLDDVAHTATVTDFYSGLPNDLVIPASVSFAGIDYAVTCVGAQAFRYHSTLTSVSIPNSVTVISKESFFFCSALTSVTIGNSVTNIGEAAFEFCNNIKKVVTPSISAWCNITFSDITANPLNKGATLYLNNEEVTALTIPDGTAKINANAFYGCSSLTSVTIPASVTEIGNKAFNVCSSLKEVNIEDGTEILKVGVFSYDNTSLFYSCSLEKGYIGRTLAYSISPFKDQSALTELTIGKYVTEISENTFDGCTSIKKINIEDGAETLTVVDSNFSNGLFYSCAIEKVYLGRSLSYSASPFINQSSLKDITIGNSVTSIGDAAFEGCSALTYIIIPASVTEISDNAFKDCTSIKEVNIEDGAETLKVGRYVDFYNIQGLFYSCPLEKIYLGRTLSYSVSPFIKQSSLTELTIGKSVTEIGTDAFRSCSSLTSITIPESITKIGDRAFDGCTGITSIVLPEAVNEIGSLAFGNIDLTEITALGITPATITDDTFSQFAKDYSDVRIPNGTFSLYKTAWPWLRVILEAGVDHDRNYTVQTPGTLVNMVNPNEVEVITSLKLTGKINGTDLLTMNKIKNLKYLDLSEATIVSGGMPYYEADNEKWGAEDNTLGKYWSYNLPLLTKIVLPTNLEYIGDYTFLDKKHLESISIPASVKHIGYAAFSGCIAIKELILEDGAEVLEIEESPYLNFTTAQFNACQIKVLHIGRNLSYDAYPLTRDRLHTLTIGNTVTSIESGEFSYCPELTSVTINSSSIGSSAFKGCTALTSATIGNSVTSIGSSAFEGCTALTSVTIGNSVTSIGSSAFEGCTALTSVTIGNSVTSIGSSAFLGCTAISSVTIPKSVTEIGSSAFKGCTTLPSVTIPNSVTEIGTSAFEGCFALKDVKLSISLKSIESSTFSGCSSLEKVTVPDPVTSIGSSAFDGCSALTEITLPGSLRKIGSDVFNGCTVLKNVYVINPVPPVMDENTFPASVTAAATLHIPEGSEGINWIHPYWGKFNSIENWTVGTQSEFVVGNVTYHITSEADATVEISEVAINGSRTGGESLTIPASVTFNGKTYRVAGIANNGFENCTAESVELPATIGYVGLEAFKGCTNLTALSIKAELPPSADVCSFDEAAYSSVKLSVPEASKSSYTAHAVWGKFAIESISDKPTDPEQPTDPEKPELPSDPEQPTDPEKPEQPTDPDKPTDPEQPTDPEKPEQPSDPDKPTDPDQPTDPENPDDETDAIEGIAGDADVCVAVEGGAIIVTAPEAAVIEVYGITGTLVRSTREHRIEGLTRGVYLVRIGSRSFKVAL